VNKDYESDFSDGTTRPIQPTATFVQLTNNNGHKYTNCVNALTLMNDGEEDDVDEQSQHGVKDTFRAPASRRDAEN